MQPPSGRRNRNNKSIGSTHVLVLLGLGALGVTLWQTLMAAVSLDFSNDDVVLKITLRRSKEALPSPEVRVHQQDTRMLTKELGNTLNRTLVVTADGCSCELISLDCISCVRHLPRRAEAAKYGALGVLTRRAIRDVTSFDLNDHVGSGQEPIGKLTQYTTIGNWRSWVGSNRLPPRLDASTGSEYANETWYPDCVGDGPGQSTLRGVSCFFAGMHADDADDDIVEPEVEAMARMQISDNITTIDALRMDVSTFQERARAKDYGNLPALGYLLAFAHMTRMNFNLRPHMRQIYKRRLKSIRNSNAIDPHDDALRVGLHLRRADSCHLSSYETEASQLDSVAQVGGKRMCYKTSVYIDALRRVQVLTKRPIDVYVSTDDSGSILEEIKNDYPSVYQSMNWHFLDYSRDLFDYQGMIEGVEGNQKALLGESAVSDLFHLSNIDVFIGHLGSRFGKMSWLLATARRNTFIPFFSVDGHSVCCEVDEVCADAKRYISNMENCLAFVYSLSGLELNKDYWEVGSTVRKTAWEKENGHSLGRRQRRR
mmetsp:Transcript_12911/g.27877  ORF Transcript_12911/g.27877 Transcript_12911/m.27877 type:complete len:541 (-) Transcript_12911:2982-4604(-)